MALEIGSGKPTAPQCPGPFLTLCSDEVLYHAKLHPEQYSDTFSDAQLKQLRESILYVCQTAVDLLADSSKFPEGWLFNHRWGKGKKDAPTSLPNGAKITFLTVGGRTSCVVPSVQKKTGAVAGDLKKENLDDLEKDEESEVKKPARGKAKAKKVKQEIKEEEKEDAEEEQPPAKSNGTSKKRKAAATTEEPKVEVSAPPPKQKKRPWTKAAPAESTASKASKARVDDTPSTATRRSGRAKK